MKRHKGIQPLSRYHHAGLLFCWKIRQGIEKNVSAQRLRLYVKHFWEGHLQVHFKEEESMLFPLLKDDITEQAIREHGYVERLIGMIVPATENEMGQFKELADALDNHIRFEERVVFPHIEREVPEETLAALGDRLSQLHGILEQDNSPDTFWV
ncbi:hemerythrin domain-containing protein [Taibaiella soli]|uniref:Hemerythrin domain-containing protein n=1 Tax=Taibaiella soli TaxID=1649169 RepID=A0A2W2BFT9_9BACT|nr:hemerythrin domain-containing protein [Taibaiella soli]PZF74757.1 hemerythrin domain-containing protein [Taibaiella soli]